MHLGDAEGKRISHDPNNFIDCIFKSVRVAFFSGEGAELAR
jgi:hypothetical protein